MDCLHAGMVPSGVRKSLYSPDYDAFLALLRAVREEAGLTQVGLAERLRTTQNYISKSESGERRVDALEWLRWLEACGADPITFLVGWNRHLDPPVALSLPSEPSARSRRSRPPQK